MNNEPAGSFDKDEPYLRRRSYLLRLAHAEEPGAGEWRASLESSETGKRIGFASLEKLFEYLMDLGESSGDSPAIQDSG